MHLSLASEPVGRYIEAFGALAGLMGESHHQQE